MAGIIYSLCALTAPCARPSATILYAQRLPLCCSGAAFASSGLTLNNLLLVLDKLVIPHVDLSPWRSAVALAAMCVLLYGLVWDAE